MDFNKIKELDAKYYMPVFSRQNLCFTHGDKNKLYDTLGNEYTDFVAGIAVNSLGYNHPALVKAISDQAAKLIHCSNLYYNEQQTTLAEKLLDGTIFSRVFFANSGAEANEGAIKLVRKHFKNKGENKYTVISALNSFHGRTLATLTLTGQEKYSKPYTPLPEGFKYVPYNDFESLKAAITDDCAAIMLESIQGEGGVVPADYEYLINAYALAKSKGLLLIMDEVQTGMGRTGKLFGFEHYGIQPDIITLAKGLGGGVPIGAVLARGDAATAFSAGDHGTTFGGNPLASAAANAVLTELKDNGLLAHAEKTGQYLGEKLSTLKKYKFVTDVRGIGLIQGIELSPKLMTAEVTGRMMKAGFLINGCGRNTLRLIPPLTITEEEIDAMVKALDKIFSETNI